MADGGRIATRPKGEPVKWDEAGYCWGESELRLGNYRRDAQTREHVTPAKAGVQEMYLRRYWLRDSRFVIPAKAGIQEVHLRCY